MAKNNLKADLDQLSRSWKDSEPSEGGSFEIPEGEHDVEIIDAEIGYSKSGRLQVVFEMELLNGDHRGKTCKKFCGMEDDDQLGYLKGDLKRLEVSIPDDINDLPDTIDSEIIGTRARIKVSVKTKKDTKYTNIYFLEKLIEESSSKKASKKPVVTDDSDDDEDDVKAAPSKRSRHSEDDDSEVVSKKKSKSVVDEDDDEDDDIPAKKKSKPVVDDADDEDDTPPRRRRR